MTTKPEPTTIEVAHCIHCGAVYLRDREHGSDTCECGAEMYPVSRICKAGERVLLGDGSACGVLGIRSRRVEVRSCRDCPMASWHHMTGFIELCGLGDFGLDHNDELSAPDECPLRDGDVVVGLAKEEP